MNNLLYCFLQFNKFVTAMNFDFSYYILVVIDFYLNDYI